MKEALISLASAFGVVLLTYLFEFIKDKRKRKEMLSDREEEKESKEEEKENTDKAEILKAISELKEEVDEIKQSTKDIEENRQRDVAVERRVRILRFADEIMHEQKHSREHFEQILDDITVYQNYCKNHESFKNEMAVSSIEIIRDNFKERMRRNDFI